MAWTKDYAKEMGLPAGADRVLKRWDPPDDIRPGWQHAVTVLMTRENMTQFATPERRADKVAVFPEPDENQCLWFRVMLGQPGVSLTIQDASEVGVMALPGGGMVGVLVRPVVLPVSTAACVAELRAHMLKVLTRAGARGNRGFGWGRMDDGAVVLIDPGPVEPRGAGSGKGGPGRVFATKIDE